ncbi:MAG: DEAD/DEAH box helicase family protein [Methanolinea sp.]|jgi:superfamily II DNA or RNA helicase|nr:DEAD/DEAH box helicase family protein [Methanolinea sp.]
MSFKDINLKKSYTSDIDDIVNDFYIPILKEAIVYKRLAGFFSSSSLAICARGILGLLKNGGKMKLIISPKISEKDYQMILKSKINPNDFIEKSMLEDIEKISNDFIRDHVFALGWMLANDKLEIKIALLREREHLIYNYEDIEKSGIFHIKVGILEDKEGNIVTFSGSINESAVGWTENIEDFKVCTSWNESQEEWLNSDISKFERFWNNLSPKVFTIDLPNAVKRKLIEISPIDYNNINLEKWEKKIKPKVSLFDYQISAINNWIDNEEKGIFEMATGTGKTFTALGCLEYAIKKYPYIFCVISCPYKHLIKQWLKDFQKFGLIIEKTIIADSSNPKWKDELTDALIEQKLKQKKQLAIITTHKTFASDSFINIILKELDPNIPGFLIADEVHGIGSPYQKRGLNTIYQMRLGLSATPRRFFDDIGTKAILDYFGKTIYKFTLEDALKKINPATNDFYLTHYRYFPIFIKLSEDELNQYILQTKRIALVYHNSKNAIEKEEILTQLFNKRANIVKNAKEKYLKLKEILQNFPPSQNGIIIYCTPQQINNIKFIVNQFHFIAHSFTMQEGTKPKKRFGGISEREDLLKKFANGDYQILIAIKILDEGVDVPSAKIAILMASSENPREYIQRIGRVIRKYPGKTEALIYDMIVSPSNIELPPELKDLEKIIFSKQLERCEYIANYAINSSQALKELFAHKV